MRQLSRKEFVQICTHAIIKTRNRITINNQISGYKQYHREIKENNYFNRHVRAPIQRTTENDFMYRHDFLEHVGLGNCHELADYLLVEIGKDIHQNNALAKLRVVSSITADHVYLEVNIRLHEEERSLWEVDAWDPRIFDISTRPDGTIKNHEYLDYGYSTKIVDSVYTDKINYDRKYRLFKDIPKPRPGVPLENATPEREMLDKHNKLYQDYTIERAEKKGKFDSSGDLHYFQKVSSWQV